MVLRTVLPPPPTHPPPTGYHPTASPAWPVARALSLSFDRAPQVTANIESAFYRHGLLCATSPIVAIFVAVVSATLISAPAVRLLMYQSSSAGSGGFGAIRSGFFGGCFWVFWGPSFPSLAPVGSWNRRDQQAATRFYVFVTHHHHPHTPLHTHMGRHRTPAPA